MPPLATDTFPLSEPLPFRVAPPSTLTAPVPVCVPFTTSVPALTMVVPLYTFLPVSRHRPVPSLVIDTVPEYALLSPAGRSLMTPLKVSSLFAPPTCHKHVKPLVCLLEPPRNVPASPESPPMTFVALVVHATMVMPPFSSNRTFGALHCVSCRSMVPLFVPLPIIFPVNSDRFGLR